MAVKDEGSIKDQLKGRKCSHPKNKQVIHTNRKGVKIKECDRCGAYLGKA